MQLKLQHQGWSGQGVALSALLSVTLLAGGAHAQVRPSSGDGKAVVNAAEYRTKMRPAAIGRGGGQPGSSLRDSVNIAYSDVRWEFFGPYNFKPGYVFSQGQTSNFISGRLNSIAFDNRNQGIFYVAAASGGAWKGDSTLGTLTWTPLGDKFPFPETSSVATDPTNGRILYVGLGDFYGPGSGQGEGLDTPRFGNNATAQGIMKSVNGGKTFVNIGNRDSGGNPIMAGAAVSSIVVSPRNPRIVVASTGRGTSPGGLWRSTDGGATWKRPTLKGGGALPTGDWNTVRVFNPYGLPYTTQAAGDPQFFYASRLNDGAYRSDDNGATWRKIANTPLAFNVPTLGGRKTLLVTPSATDPYVVYFMDTSSNFDDGRIFRGQPEKRADINGSGALNYLWTEITDNYNSANGQFNNWSRSEYASSLLAAPAALLPPQPPPAPFPENTALDLDILYGGNRTVSASLGADRFFTLNVMLEPSLWQDLSFSHDSPLTSRDRFHSWQRDLKYDPFDPQQVLVANDGGVYGIRFDPDNTAAGFSSASLGSPGHWFTTTNLNTSGNLAGQPVDVRKQAFAVTQINGADFSPTNADLAIVGTQNMGLGRFLAGSSGWTAVATGSNDFSAGAAILGTRDLGLPIGNYVGNAAFLGTRQFAWVLSGGGGHPAQRLVMTTDNWSTARDISPDQSFTGFNTTFTALEEHFPFPYSRSGSDDGGTDTSIFTAFSGQAKSTNPVLVGDTASGRLFTGTNALWWYNPTGVETGFDGTATQGGHAGRWKMVGTNTFGGVITAIAVTYSTIPGNRRVYVGTSTGEVWVSNNSLSLQSPPPLTGPAASTATWTQINNGTLPLRPVTSISVNPSRHEDIVLTLGGTGGGHVFRCQNTFSSSVAFTDQSGSVIDPANPNFFTRLPDVPVNGIARDAADPVNTLYIATDIGVFVTTDQGSTWQDATTPLGLPNVQCTAIKYVAGTGNLNVATYGRGVWRIKTTAATQVFADPNLKAAFTLNRIGNEIFAVVTVTNEQKKDALGNNVATGLAENVQITASSIVRSAATSTITTLPITLGAIAPGSSRSLTLRYPGTAGPSGSAATFKVSGTYVTQSLTGPVANNTSFPDVRTRLP